jgi:hypothetical protein
LKNSRKSEKTKEARSETPIGFANAFYEANKYEDNREDDYQEEIQLELF